METSELLVSKPITTTIPPFNTFNEEVLHHADELSRMVGEVQNLGPSNRLAVEFMYAAKKAYDKVRQAMR